MYAPGPREREHAVARAYGDRCVLLRPMQAYKSGDCALCVARVALLRASTSYSTSGAADARPGAALACFDLHSRVADLGPRVGQMQYTVLMRRDMPCHMAHKQWAHTA